ncbi:hypothetical protein PMAYCL1PPCAC_20839, partial [Pristionchus mayeri]
GEIVSDVSVVLDAVLDYDGLPVRDRDRHSIREGRGLGEFGEKLQREALENRGANDDIHGLECIIGRDRVGELVDGLSLVSSGCEFHSRRGRRDGQHVTERRLILDDLRELARGHRDDQGVLVVFGSELLLVDHLRQPHFDALLSLSSIVEDEGCAVAVDVIVVLDQARITVIRALERLTHIGQTDSNVDVAVSSVLVEEPALQSQRDQGDVRSVHRLKAHRRGREFEGSHVHQLLDGLHNLFEEFSRGQLRFEH